MRNDWWDAFVLVVHLRQHTLERCIWFNGFNVMFTFCLCLGLLSVLDSKINIVFKVIAVALGIYISTFCDWSVYAPVFTLLFVWSRNSAPRTKIAMALCLLFFAGATFLRGYGVALLGQVIRISLLSILGISLAGICFVFFYNGKQRKETTAFSKWFFYIFYPAHLLLLGLLRVALPG